MEIVLSNVVKRYGNVVAVNGINLTVRGGEFVTLLGPSGCGKTTTLRSIAGLEKIDDGEIRIGDDVVSGKRVFVPPERRNLGMIFQSYAIWPHMTVFDNVGYGLKIKRRPAAEIKERVFKALEMVGLSSYAERYATQLSGGQQQRVAIARSIALEPRVLLFDEPLSNLDAKLREQMRFELRELQKKLGITSIYVTHDQSEAMALSDRIVVMNEGNIVQIGNPWEVYLRPRDTFVANFLGVTNLIQGVIQERLQGDVVRARAGSLQVVCEVPSSSSRGDEVLLSLRPEQVKMLWEPPNGEFANVWKARIETHTFLGDQVDVKVQVSDAVWRLSVHPNDFALGEGRSECYLVCDPQQIIWIPQKDAVSEGDRVDAPLAREA